MSPRHWRDRIRDILEAIREIDDFLAGLAFEDFASDLKTIKAVTADFAIIGEAANHVPDEVRDLHREVPWEEMRRMRNVVVHVYHGVDPLILWDTSKNDLPTVKPLLERILEDSSEGAA